MNQYTYNIKLELRLVIAIIEVSEGGTLGIWTDHKNKELDL